MILLTRALGLGIDKRCFYNIFIGLNQFMVTSLDKALDLNKRNSVVLTNINHGKRCRSGRQASCQVYTDSHVIVQPGENVKAGETIIGYLS